MNSTIKSAPSNPGLVEGIPHSFISEFQAFQNLLLGIENSLNENNSESYLTQNFLNWRNKYYEIAERLGEICFNQDSNVKEKIKEYVSKSKVFQLHLEAPYYKQIILKPRGYAGDADMMNIIYRNEFEGNSSIGRVLHKFATECTACEAVRNRKTLLHKLITESTGKILSVAAGPAAEILDFLKNKTCADLSFTALDHDIETILEVKKNDKENLIKYAIVNVFHLLKGHKTILFPKQKMGLKFNPGADSKGLRKIFLPFKYSIKRLKPQSYDLIYSAGLYDYIETFENDKKGTKALTRELFSLLKPGGVLVIGNFSTRNPINVKWIMEFICDWHLLYRDEAEILSFASSIPKSSIHSIEVIREDTGINYFLKVVKNKPIINYPTLNSL